MLIGQIYIKQPHLILQDVDGSEVSLTLDDALDVSNFVKDHMQEIEAQITSQLARVYNLSRQRGSEAVGNRKTQRF
jgi:hypothetical protein